MLDHFDEGRVRSVAIHEGKISFAFNGTEVDLLDKLYDIGLAQTVQVITWLGRSDGFVWKLCPLLEAAELLLVCQDLGTVGLDAGATEHGHDAIQDRASLWKVMECLFKFHFDVI